MKTVEIVRDDDKVRLTVQCGEVYEAMQLYDELCEACQSGYLKLTAEIPPRETAHEEDQAVMQLQPKDGFDWKKVTWGRPDSVRSALCSYCSAVIPETSVPLIMWTNDSHAAQFCLPCQKKWWGFEGFDEEDEP